MLAQELEKRTIPKKDTHYSADFAEICCLQSPDRSISFSEVFDEEWGGDEGLGGIGAHEDCDILAVEEDPDGKRDPHWEMEDKKSNKLSDVYEVLKARPKLFGDCYPFVVHKWGLELGGNASNCGLYVLLLLAANSHCFADNKQALRNDFECVATIAMQALFPPPFTVKLFGTAQCGAIPCYTGTKRQKLEAFAEDVKGELRIREADLARMGTGGDGGIDLAAFYQFPDPAAQFPLYICQAGCTADEDRMQKKQHDVARDKWMNKIGGIQPASVMFTPSCYRDPLGEWMSPSDIFSVFMDRPRIVHLLKDEGLPDGLASVEFARLALAPAPKVWPQQEKDDTIAA